MSRRLADIMDSQGRAIRLGAVLGRGGEGAVYETSLDANIVAKVYHAALPPEKADKIRIMSSLRNDRLTRLTAWPIDLLSLGSSRTPVGLLMPKVSGRKDIHYLYSPKSRRAEFQRADWRFLIRAAANTARAFHVVHDAGCVIGDVNHGSVLVAQDATVRLIDCDSFQIVAQARRFLCEVGVETFTPPELQGKSFRGVIRTDNHDNFGLATLVFLMLFMGRHPFAGRFLGAGEMPIPRAVKECRFAYGARRATVQMEKPPGTPALSIVGDDLAFLFERAFAREMVAGGRPTPSEWIEELQRLERSLKQCSNPSHWHHKEQACPWCSMEGATGVPLFPLMVPAGGAVFDAGALWRQIEQVAHPGPVPEIAEPPVQPSQAAQSLGQARGRRLVTASVVAGLMIAGALFGELPSVLPLVLFISGVAAFFMLLNVLDKSDEVRSFELAQDQASSNWSEMQREWLERAGPGPFDRKKRQLTEARTALSNLPNVRLRMLDELKRNQRAVQLARFLDAFEIDHARIAGIGPGRKQTLESYGIETAADLTPAALVRVPGFGPKTKGKLMKWRGSLERRFVFDPAKAIDPRDIADVEQQVQLERQKLEERLRNGLTELRQVHGQILAVRQNMMARVSTVHAAYLQAAANCRAAKST